MPIYRHIYNRGAHKEIIFRDYSDYWRMIKLLYIANYSKPFILSNLPENVFCILREDTLVDIVAYCLMPNHIHIAIRSRDDENVTKFMRKLCTAYSCYYNIKYDHSGTIWQGKYKSKEKFDELNIHILLNYIHMNPFAPDKDAASTIYDPDPAQIALDKSKNYVFSSFKDYLGENRLQRSILSTERSDL